MNSRQPHLVGLDLVRGVTALTVLIYHADFMFGLRGTLLPGGYIAVDLFFVLSGFVIARTYEDDIATGRISLREFWKRRFARLYPLYLATTLVGIIVMTARFRSTFGFFDTLPLVVTAAVNLVCVPTPVAPYGDAMKSLFPFNAASWSISYELLANLIYCTSVYRLPTKWLFGVWLCLFALIVDVAFKFGGVDVGWDQSNMLPGMVRVCFSFTTGILIWRALKRRKRPSSRALLYVLIAVQLLSIQAQHWMPAEAKPWMDIVLIGFFLPLMVTVAAGASISGAARPPSRFVGDVSYAVYLTQDALIIAAAGLTQVVLHTKIFDLAPLSGLLFVPFCVAASYFVFKYFEMPARRALRAMHLPVWLRPFRKIEGSAL